MPNKGLKIKTGASVTQSGGTINTKDLKIVGNQSEFIQNENSGTSLVTVGHDFKNENDFISTAGTIEWTGE
ncbi:MAG: hypothetical protein ACI8ZN_002368 [Bacteroidia bacterium]